MANETLYKTLYKLNTNGSTQVWEIHRNHNSYWSVSGKLGGKMIVNEPTLVTPKQTRTLEEQVEFYCESQVNKKKDKKYVENVEDIHRADGDLVGFSAMLAHSYEKQKSKIKFPCIVQPKLDGIRCLSTVDGFFSRGRKEFTSCPHIREELAKFFEGNPKARLDGEFYTHEFKEDFEKICKAVKKSADKAEPSDLEFQKKVQLHLYDAPRIGTLTDTDSFQKRQAELAKTFADYKYIHVVETVVVNNEDEMLACKERWIEEGYEGIMLRNIDSPYEGKRSYNLQKFKDFIDDEFEIIGVNEGNGKLAGHAGSFTFKMKSGNTFDAKMIGSTSRLKDLFEHQSKCIGKMATVRYQNLSADGNPRFPVCRGIRDYE
jgi:DNA ligase-1